MRIAKTSALTEPEDRERATLDTTHRQSRGIQQYDRLEAVLTWSSVSSDRLNAYPAHQHIRQTGSRQTAQSPSSTSNQLVLPSRSNPRLSWAARYPTNPLHNFATSSSHLPHKMPIPESEYFLSRKPTVPPTFDGVDYNDNKALKAAQDAVIREQWVRSMMARLVRDEMGKCYRREGVNHLEKCGPLRGELCC